MVDASQTELEASATQDDDLAHYGAVSKLAVVGLLLGLSSVLGLFVPLFWLLAFLGIWASAAALRQIRALAPALSGRSIALAGLCISIIFGTAVPAQLVTTRWWITRQADVFAQQWLECLQAGQPHKALQLMVERSMRRDVTNSAELWKHYRGDEGSRRDLATFVRHPVPRVLLALEGRARVRLYDETIEQLPSRERVTLLYAVTYSAQGGKRTFFVRLEVVRAPNPLLGTQDMHVSSFAGPVKPTL